jgi:hypothetical protein
MIATMVMMKNTPPRTPPMIGARGKLLPRLVKSFSLRPAEKDGPPDNVEEVEEIEFVVFEGVSNVVGYWRTEGLRSERPARGGGILKLTEESIGVFVGFIIVDLFVRDADVARGHEGFRIQRRGRERRRIS